MLCRLQTNTPTRTEKKLDLYLNRITVTYHERNGLSLKFNFKRKYVIHVRGRVIHHPTLR